MMRSLSACIRFLVTSALLALAWVYRHLISPPLHAWSGPAMGCRFHPNCSQYAADALRVHGPVRGLALAVARIAKCHPFHPGGVDLVPPVRPRCTRVATSQS